MNFKKLNAKEWQTIGFAALVALLAYIVYAGWGKHENPLGRSYLNCPSDTTLYEGTTFGFTLCIPKSWENKYATEYTDRITSFAYTGKPNERRIIFKTVVVPETYWNESQDLQQRMRIVAKDDGRVFALVIPNDPAPSGYEEFGTMRGEINKVTQSIAFSSYKSIDRTIEDFIETKLGLRSRGGKVFGAYEFLGKSEESDGVHYYIWAHIKEFVKKDGVLEEGSTVNVPVALTIKSQALGNVVTDFKIPRSGPQFFEDLPKIFPERIVKSEWFNPDLQYHNRHISILADIARSKARAKNEIKGDKKFGYIKQFSPKDGERNLGIDPVTVLTGGEAILAMRADGSCDPLAPNCELPNGYYLLNKDNSIESYKVALGAQVILKPGLLLSYIELQGRMGEASSTYENKPFYFEIENGKIVKIAEQ